MGKRLRGRAAPPGKAAMTMSEITSFLEERGVRFEVVGHVRARTSVGEAMTIGVRTDCVLKSLLAVSGSRTALLVVPASTRLDMRLVREALNDHHARLATEAELTRDLPRFELGALPPLGSLLGVEMFVDPSLLQHGRVAFADGSQMRSIVMDLSDLLAGESFTVRPLTVHAGAREQAAVA